MAKKANTAAVKKVEKQPEARMSNRSIMVSLIIALVLALGAAGYFYVDSQKAHNNTIEAIAQRNQQESSQVVVKLESILLETTDQEPTVARVENAQTLKESNPEFYKNVQNGDYIVLYPQRAVIYREEIDQIINIAPIVNTQGVQTTEEPAQIEETQAENE